MKINWRNKSFIGFSICLILFIAVLLLVLLKENLSVDRNSYQIIKEYLMSDENTIFFTIVTNLGGVIVLVIFTIIFFLFLTNKKISIAIAINLITSFTLNSFIKLIIQRERPLSTNWLISESGYSFPSGHSAVSLAYYGFLIYLVFKYIKNKKYRIVLMTILIVLILLIGISRMYLGVHYLSDVIAGYLLTGGYLIIFVYFFNKNIDKSHNSTSS